MHTGRLHFSDCDEIAWSSGQSPEGTDSQAESGNQRSKDYPGAEDADESQLF